MYHLLHHSDCDALCFLLIASLIPLWNSFYPSRKRDYNVLLITIYSFRPGHLGCYGYKRDTSLNIDRIAKEGVLFTEAYSTASWTLPGLASLLSFLYPSVHGLERRNDVISADIPTFPKLLKDYGYNNPGLCFLLTLPEFANMGFDTLEDVQLAKVHR